MQNIYAINSNIATNTANAAGAAGATKASRITKATNFEHIKTIIRKHQASFNAKIAPFKAKYKVVTKDEFGVNIEEYPDKNIIYAIKLIINAGIATQKTIAQTVGLSQTKMSQYMNANRRLKGWRDSDTKLAYYAQQHLCVIGDTITVRSNGHVEQTPQTVVESSNYGDHIEPIETIESVCETPEEQLDAPTYNFGDAIYTFNESLYVEAPVKHTMQNVYQTQQATNDYWDYYTNAVDFNNDNFNWSE